MGPELKMLSGHATVLSTAFSRDSTRIISGSFHSSVRVWDTLTGVELKMLNGHASTAWSVTISSDGTRNISGSIDGSVRVWDASRVALKELTGQKSE